jgi:hypothetical protein
MVVKVIVIARLHAMYQQSKQMLVFLVVIFVTIEITCGVIVAFNGSHISGGKLLL